MTDIREAVARALQAEIFREFDFQPLPSNDESWRDYLPDADAAIRAMESLVPDHDGMCASIAGRKCTCGRDGFVLALKERFK